MESMEDGNKFSITHPLMLSSLHLSAALPSLMSCSFASHLHPFMSHLSLLTPFSGSQASCVLGFSPLLPYCIIFPLSLFLPLLLVFPLLCVIVIADPSICARCGRGLGSFNLPNKLTASFSSIMCVCERDMVFCLFWMCVSGATLKHFPELYGEATVHLAY